MRLSQSNQTFEVVASPVGRYDAAVVLRIGAGSLLRFVLTPAEASELADRLTQALEQLDTGATS